VPWLAPMAPASLLLLLLWRFPAVVVRRALARRRLRQGRPVMLSFRPRIGTGP
jgi:hypothetical protein